jgi:energy-coupling factor transporter ATP-binding protein EcfA2
VLILDEVLAVGDVSFQAKCLNRLADLRQKGVPFILVGHNMQQISRYCQKVIILKKGIIKFCGNAEEGIALYLNDMHDIKAISKNNALKWSMPNGSGKLVFTGSQFYNLDRQIVSKVKSEEGIIFSISYEKKDVDLKIPIFDVSIYANGEQIFQSTSKGKIKLQNLSTRGCFELQLSSIPVNCKLIEFRCCAMDEETNELFDWKRGIFISVERDSKQLGILKLQHCWNAN